MDTSKLQNVVFYHNETAILCPRNCAKKKFSSNTNFEWMCNTAREIEAATQPLCQNGCRSHSATQPLWQSG
jgi:hypothetical protein